MRYVTRVFLKGLGAALPTALTVYLLYWLGKTLELILKPIIIYFLPDDYYWPGMGLLIGVALIFCIGLLVEAYIVRQLFKIGDGVLEKIPLVKSIYSSLRDFIKYLTRLQDSKEMQRVVVVNFGDTRLMGFVTKDDSDSRHEDDLDGLVSVYLPMSYNIGGFTVHVPRSMTTPYDISVEDAMRKILTAELSDTKQVSDN